MVFMDLLTVIYFCRGQRQSLWDHCQRRRPHSLVMHWETSWCVPAEISLNCWTSCPFQNDFVSSRLPQSAFSPKPCRRLYFWLSRRNHVADVFFDYFGKQSPKPFSSLPLFLYYQHGAFIRTLGTWFGLRLTILDALHRFREVLQGDLL